MIVGPILMILIVVGIVAGIILPLGVVPRDRTRFESHAAPSRALSFLRNVYATGEIELDEFTDFARSYLLDLIHDAPGFVAIGKPRALREA